MASVPVPMPSTQQVGPPVAACSHTKSVQHGFPGTGNHLLLLQFQLRFNFTIIEQLQFRQVLSKLLDIQRLGFDLADASKDIVKAAIAFRNARQLSRLDIKNSRSCFW
jgi:hypothetical protein